MSESTESRPTAAERVPGKLSASQAGAEAEVMTTIETILASLQRKAMVLETSIRNVDFLAAWRAANDLSRTLAHAEAIVAAIGSPGLDQRVAAARAVAGPLLAVAPSPSATAVQEAVSKDRHGKRSTWDAERSEEHTSELQSRFGISYA